VDVLPDEKKVRVRVRNVVERSNAIRTVFARVLGWDQVDISTVAAAEAQPAGEGMCPIPLALPDRWYDNNDDDLYDGPPEWYEPFPGGDLPGQQDVHYTGYDLDDAAFGTLLEIKTGGGPAGGGSGNSICASQDQASWRCWFQPEAINGGAGGGGVDALRPWIRHCPDLGFTLEVGDQLYAASGSGNKQSLIHDADGVDPDNYDFGDLVEEFPGVWRAGQPCPMVPVLDGNRNPTGAEECAGPGNLRVRVMPVVSPEEIYDTGSNLYAIVSQLVCVWIDKVAKDPTAAPSTVSGPAGRRNLYVRIYDGCGGDGQGTGEFLWKLRLVE